jgi:hypothetical protein
VAGGHRGAPQNPQRRGRGLRGVAKGVARIHLPHKRLASPTGRSTPGAGTVTNYVEPLPCTSSLVPEVYYQARPVRDIEDPRGHPARSRRPHRCHHHRQLSRCHLLLRGTMCGCRRSSSTSARRTRNRW